MHYSAKNIRASGPPPRALPLNPDGGLRRPPIPPAAFGGRETALFQPLEPSPSWNPDNSVYRLSCASIHGFQVEALHGDFREWGEWGKQIREHGVKRPGNREQRKVF